MAYNLRRQSQINYDESSSDDEIDKHFYEVKEHGEYLKRKRKGKETFADVLRWAPRPNDGDHILKNDDLFIFAMNTWCLENDSLIEELALNTDNKDYDYIPPSREYDNDRLFCKGWELWNDKVEYGDEKEIADVQHRMAKEYDSQQMYRHSSPSTFVMPLKIWRGFYTKLKHAPHSYKAQECFDVLIQKTPFGEVDPHDFFSHATNQKRFKHGYEEFLNRSGV